MPVKRRADAGKRQSRAKAKTKVKQEKRFTKFLAAWKTSSTKPTKKGFFPLEHVKTRPTQPTETVDPNRTGP